MKIFFRATYSLLLATTVLRAETSENRGTPETLAAAETAFAGESLARGMRTAFLRALAEDAIVFEPLAQNGRKTWEAKPASDAVLDWKPLLAITSAAGDLGYTAGPWSYKKKPSDAQPAAYGWFISIWRWRDGDWKVALDIDGGDAPNEQNGKLQLVANRAPNESAEQAKPKLLQQEKLYVRDRLHQLAKCGRDDARFFWSGKSPALSRDSAASAIHETKPLKFSEPITILAESGDLAGLYGDYKTGDGEEAVGAYLRIWRRENASDWKLALEVLHPR